MTDDDTTDQLFTLAERTLMLAGVVLLVVALVLASPLGFLTNFGGDDGDEAAAAGTPTPAPDEGTHAQEPAATDGTADSTSTAASDEGTPTMEGPVMGTATPTEEPTPTPTETEDPTPTPTEEPTPAPTETDDGPGIGPGNPPGQDDD